MNKEKKDIHVLLYYHFAPIQDKEAFALHMRTFCKEIGLKGRILVSEEGINGTCAGTKEQAEQYKTYLTAQKGFENTWFKEQIVTENPFRKMFVRPRNELVTLRIDNVNHTNGGKHISPDEVNKMAQEDDVVFFDARNIIESKIGRFKNAITPNMKTFRDLPKVLEEHKKDLEGKRVIMYCTGGIRCEKATVVAKQLGIEDVYQIDGGIYNYCNNNPNGLFQGTCYVFDDRTQVGWNEDGSITDEANMKPERLISHCEFCNTKTSRVVNDERFLNRVEKICCQACDTEHDISRKRTKEERIEMRKTQDPSFR